MSTLPCNAMAHFPKSRKKVSLSLVANPSLDYPQISSPMLHAFCSNFVP
jgi:hypothetical protein